MPHPYIEVNKKSWGIILTSLQQTIALIASGSGSTEAQADAYLNQYSSVINANANGIYEAATTGINQYINFYNISPKEGVYDEFKNIYFLGTAITIWLNKSGLADLNKLHQKAMLRLLDLRLLVPHDVRRPTLSDRVTSAINNNALNEHFGMYGWYIVYKCLFNAANLRSKSI